MREFLTDLRRVTGFDRAIVRGIAAWCWTAALLSFRNGSFTDLAFGQETSLFVVLLAVVGFFFAFSVAAVLADAWHLDSWLLFGAALVCSIRWLWVYNGNQSFLFLLDVCAALCLFAIYTLYHLLKDSLAIIKEFLVF